ncbi:MAG: Lipopolysaccharide export system ATP-binding protein LptB [Chlamydiia bacterium]|nr:Lipopolysaccharide export system ATP-binding protein LptB [Chlamydiia bacterium]
MFLKVKNLTVKIRKHTILQDISFDIEKGSIVGLLGANGAGKTTTFHALIGLLKTSKGNIYLDGQDITKLPMYKRARLGIGYLSQEPSIFRELTVEENLLIYLEMHKLKKDEKQKIVDQRLAELNLLHLKKKKASHLSGGERRRVEISRALITNPKILFLDEPFANIDPKTIDDVKDLIKFLKAKDITIFITDHNAYELLSFIDKGLFLHHGKLLATGTTKELINNSSLKKHYLGSNFSLK